MRRSAVPRVRSTSRDREAEEARRKIELDAASAQIRVGSSSILMSAPALSAKAK